MFTSSCHTFGQPTVDLFASKAKQQGNPGPRNSEDDTVSLFGGDEFQNPEGEEDADQFLKSIDLSLHPNEISGPPISEKISK